MDINFHELTEKVLLSELWTSCDLKWTQSLFMFVAGGHSHLKPSPETTGQN
jgi:hypothetical protein